jgi:hypothetical protein
MHLREGVFNELGRIADRLARQQIEIDGDAGELIEMVDRLWPDDLLCRRDRAQRHQIGPRPAGGSSAAARPAGLSIVISRVAAHVQVIEIRRRSALVIFYFQDDLILIVRLLD